MCLYKCQEAPTKVGFLKILQRSLVLFLCGRLSSTALPFLSYLACLVPLIPLTPLYRRILSSIPRVPYLFPDLCKHSKWNSISEYYKIASINGEDTWYLSFWVNLPQNHCFPPVHSSVNFVFFCSWIISCWANAPRFHYPLMVISDSSTFWLLWAEQRRPQMGSCLYGGSGCTPKSSRAGSCVYIFLGNRYR